MKSTKSKLIILSILIVVGFWAVFATRSKNSTKAVQKEQAKLINQATAWWGDIQTPPIGQVAEEALAAAKIMTEEITVSPNQIAAFKGTVRDFWTAYSTDTFESYTNFHLRYPWSYYKLHEKFLKMEWENKKVQVANPQSIEAIQATWKIFNTGHALTGLDPTRVEFHFFSATNSNNPLGLWAFRRGPGTAFGTGIRIIQSDPSPDTIIKKHGEVTYGIVSQFIRSTCSVDGVTPEQKAQATPLYAIFYWDPENNRWLPSGMGSPGIAGTFKSLF